MIESTGISGSVKKFVMFISLLLISGSIFAADCDPILNPGCETDLPLDSHIWVLLLFVSIIALYSFYNKKKAVL